MNNDKMQLIIVDTAQIQPYLFGSNRLRENIGASHLVSQATKDWVFTALPTPNNVNANGSLDDNKSIEKDSNLAAEVIYAGGGNSVLLLRSECGAKAFARQLSQRSLEQAPGLQLVMESNEFDWKQSLSKTVQETFRKLAKKKRAQLISAPLLGLGVTVMCQSTGLPAVAMTESISGDPTSVYPASSEIHAKIAVARPREGRMSEADKRLYRMISPPEGFDYPRDFDELGRTAGEHSYIAVVHADGNGVGKIVQDIGRRYQKPEENGCYISTMRKFSNAVEKAAQTALQATLSKLISLIIDNHGQIVHKNSAGKELAYIKLKWEDNKGLLPFRPIVFGGDDVTFVSDGRIGLSLAVEYLRQFEEQTSKHPDCQGKITACAGIAIVKAHYPFARAYKLAEELCKSAKKYRREKKLEGSCLDWHFATSGLSGDIEEIRRREYTTAADDSLILRPVTLEANPLESHRAWTVVQKGIESFQGSDWAGRRNKVKALRDALREGSESVEIFRMKFNEGKSLPDVEPTMANWPIQGWQGGYCGYFDAIELADWFIPL